MILANTPGGWEVKGCHGYAIAGNAIEFARGYAVNIHDNYIEDFGQANAASTTYRGIYVSIATGRGTRIVNNGISCAEPSANNSSYEAIHLRLLTSSTARAVIGMNEVAMNNGTNGTGVRVSIVSGGTLRLAGVRTNSVHNATTRYNIDPPPNIIVEDHVGTFRVRAASLSNISLPPGGTSLVIDGVTMANNELVLLKNQTTTTENDIYVVSGVGTSVVLTRYREADRMSAGSEVSVAEGTEQKEMKWLLAADDPIIFGTTPLRFTRTYPSYSSSPQKNPWDIGTTAPICSNMDRESATAALLATTAATTSLHGKMVIPAGKLITNINCFCTAAGASYTILWFAIVRASDRVVLERTANTTTPPTINAVHQRQLLTPITLDVDTPVYIALACAATTAPSFAGTAAGLATFLAQAPLISGNSSTTPTSTPPAVGAVLGAPAAGRTQFSYFWLT
jgi:hypothetical protein